MEQREKSTFSKWLETTYLDWQRKRGGRVLQNEFAEWLGISKQLLSQYLNGRSAPTEERIDQLAEKLGPEVYDVLGLRRPDGKLNELLRVYDAATPEQKDEIIRQALRVIGYEPE
jgi:transcriptional regulator with XRE-family HTH domain